MIASSVLKTMFDVKADAMRCIGNDMKLSQSVVTHTPQEKYNKNSTANQLKSPWTKLLQLVRSQTWPLSQHFHTIATVFVITGNHKTLPPLHFCHSFLFECTKHGVTCHRIPNQYFPLSLFQGVSLLADATNLLFKHMILLPYTFVWGTLQKVDRWPRGAPSQPEGPLRLTGGP